MSGRLRSQHVGSLRVTSEDWGVLTFYYVNTTFVNLNTIIQSRRCSLSVLSGLRCTSGDEQRRGRRSTLTEKIYVLTLTKLLSLVIEIRVTLFCHKIFVLKVGIIII